MDIHDRIQEIFESESRRVFASLGRLLGDLDLAEDALQEAFATALRKWPAEGIPRQPASWLVSAGRFRAIDMIRRDGKLMEIAPHVAERLAAISTNNKTRAAQSIEDDRLRLIFACCHPAIDIRVQVPLTLREVCGLTTQEIASAFLTSAVTMAQRIVRGKAKIRDARIPIELPDPAELPQRLDAVLTVIYLIFNEGYSASHGSDAIRSDLTQEAIRLGRLVLELHPDPEVTGLLALMLLHESRRETRTTEDGDIVLLENQDRSRWNQALIQEGRQLVAHALQSGDFGAYTLQAAISAVHAAAETANDTDWSRIVALYDVLLTADASPVLELNRAVAIAMKNGPAEGLKIIDHILERGDLADYSLAHSARGELLRRTGDFRQARLAFERARGLCSQAAEQRFLDAKIRDVIAATADGG